MRKIFSILVVLGLVLGMVVMTAPAAAQTCTGTLDLTNDCAGGSSTYTLTFAPTNSMLPGNDLFILEFGAGTTFGTFVLGDITVDGVNVPLAGIVKDGTTLSFPTPVAIMAGTPATIVVAKVVNPAVPGPYKLLYSIKLVCCDPVYQGCADYVIKPAYSTYKFLLDFGPTYDGICPEFIPPFKACGQENFGIDLGDGMWATAFNFTLTYDVLGCAAPCADASLYMIPTVVVPGATVTFDFGGFDASFDSDDVGEVIGLVDPVAMTPDLIVSWLSSIHFDLVGEYEICFYLECPGFVDACDEEPSAIIAERCVPFTVHQWKDAVSIDLYRKWNLISLPLVPFETDIDAILAALCPNDEILSIWHFDQCVDSWFVWGNGQTSLTDIEDGKAYWVRIAYDNAVLGEEAGEYYGTLWLWGHEKPMPPLSPSVYEVCAGWNMVGFTSMVVSDDDTYLWNWNNMFMGYEYGAIYGWTAGTQTWNIQFPGAAVLTPGEGYWIPFDHDGYIYP